MKKPVKPPLRYSCQGQDQEGQAGEGNRKNISAEAHRRASAVARMLMKMQHKQVKSKLVR